MRYVGMGLAILFIFVGIFMSGDPAAEEPGITVGLLLTFGGVIWLIVGAVMANRNRPEKSAK